MRAPIWLVLGLAACGARTGLSEPLGEPPEPPCLSSGAWAPIAPMLVPRDYHVVAPLPDGGVVALGGLAGEGPTASAERWDPLADQWSELPPLAGPRVFHTATRLLDGRVLVVGGYDGNPDGTGAGLTDCELFDPDANSLSPAPPLPTGRYFHDAVRLADGRVLVVGGFQLDVGLPRVALFDPDAASWVELDAPEDVAGGYVAAAPRAGGAWVAAFDGVYAFDAAALTFTLVHPVADLQPPILNLPRLGARGERFVVMDGSARVGAGSADALTWQPEPQWPPDGGVAPRVVLPLCDRVLAPGSATWTFSLADGAKLGEEAIGLFAPSGAVLDDGALLLSGGMESSGGSVEARVFR